MSTLLRFATAGSVDDGKSTLIGRLLHDTKSLFDDTIDAVAASTARRGGEGLDLSLVTDGLRAEREQGITIDVAYRYFATPKRSFIIADTPGHVQYTRNMVTGASTSDVAVILVDARHGVREQSRRHACIAALLGIRHHVVAVNKMDLVGWSRDRFEEVVAELRDLVGRLGVDDVTGIPLCALDGGNVVEPSPHTPWYDGPTLLHHLETLPLARDEERTGLRLPVQWVIRPPLGSGEARWYAGTVASGSVEEGAEVVVLPSGHHTRVTAVEGDTDAVRVQLADELDVSRGDILSSSSDRPRVTDEVEATVCWLSEQPLRAGAPVLLKSATRTVKARVDVLRDRLDVTTLERAGHVDELVVNDIATLHLRTSELVVVDPYERNRTTGSFILIDPVSNATVGAGLVHP
ncbi:MAG TPA: GTP-binding protein [Acidimicrobiales bacterium]